ncbi:MAG: hypothetical protein HWE10_11405 [Gammaproteobacteria bacterium]|nr:hypothetical protein [Gammaproteobacteria bacterium]
MKFVMNRHTKMALLVAPFLAMIGWVASDIWVESQTLKNQLYTLEAEAGYCDVMAKKCILHANDLKISVYQQNNKTVLNSTMPLDSATFFMVDNSDNARPFLMAVDKSPYYWSHPTDFADVNQKPGSKQKFRIIAAIKGSRYIGEFVSTTLGSKI